MKLYDTVCAVEYGNGKWFNTHGPSDGAKTPKLCSPDEAYAEMHRLEKAADSFREKLRGDLDLYSQRYLRREIDRLTAQRIGLKIHFIDLIPSKTEMPGI